MHNAKENLRRRSISRCIHEVRRHRTYSNPTQPNLYLLNSDFNDQLHGYFRVRLILDHDYLNLNTSPIAMTCIVQDIV